MHTPQDLRTPVSSLCKQCVWFDAEVALGGLRVHIPQDLRTPVGLLGARSFWLWVRMGSLRVQIPLAYAEQFFTLRLV